MHDSVATFYGGYDQTGVGRLPSLRFKPIYLAVGAAVIVLLILIAADVSAAGSSPASIHVSSVQWYVGQTLLASTGGFTVSSGQHFVETLSCTMVCLNFVGASVAVPFTLVSFSVVNEPAQYTNLTIAAPSSGYSGILSITMLVGSTSSLAPAFG